MAVVDILKYVLELDSGKFENNAAASDAIVSKLAGTIKDVLTGALGGLATGFAAVKIGEFLKDATLLASREEVLQTALHAVGATANYQAAELDQLTERISTLGFTAGSSREFLVRMVQNEIDLSNATKLARVALDMTAISGMSASEVLETMTQSISALMPRQLKALGLVVNLADANKNYATSVGKVAADLTEVEQRQAMVNEILEKGTHIAGTYDAALQNAGGQMSLMSVRTEELKDAIGSNLLPVLSMLIDLLSQSAEGFKKAFTSDIETAIAGITKLVSAYEKERDALPELVKRFEELSAQHRNGTELSKELASAQSRIALLAPELITGYSQEGVALGITTQALEKYLASKKAEVESVTALGRIDFASKLAEERAALDDLVKRRDEYEAAARKREGGGLTQGDVVQLDIFSRHIRTTIENIGELENAIANLPGGTTDAMTKLRTGFEQLQLSGDIEIPFAFKFEGGVDAVLNSPEVDAAWRILNERFSKIKIDFGTEGGSSSISELSDRIDSLIERARVKFGKEGIMPDKAKYEAEVQAIIDANQEIPDDLKAKLLLALKDFEGASKETAANIADALSYAASNFFALFDEGIARVANDLGNAISGAISGFSVGGVAGIASAFGAIVSGLGALFSSTDAGNQELIVTQHELIDAIEAWQNTIDTMSAGEKQQQVTGAQQIVDIFARTGGRGLFTYERSQIQSIIDKFGLKPPEGLTDQQLFQWAESIVRGITISDAQTRRILEASTKEQRTAAVAGAKDATEAINTVQSLISLFALTPEEQAALWREVLADFPSLSNDQLIQVNTTLADIMRNLASGGDTGPAAEQTQISRSIARITERQADSLVSIMSTMDMHLQDGFNAVVRAIQNLLTLPTGNIGFAGGGSQSVTMYNTFYNMDANQTVKVIKNELNANVRSVGGVRYQ
jgi:hypothetical protein